MRFDLADLSLFRHVVEAGSITGGAERANLALAAASTRIRNMEQALGAALLVRGRQGVTPTQAGRTLLQHARAILRQAERLREDLGVYAGGLAGQIRVLSNTNALTEFLPGALSSFLSEHPIARRSNIAFADVLEHDFVGLDRASALQRFLADKAARIGQPLRLRVQLRSFDAVCRLVECNVGIGIVPEATSRRVVRTMAIVPVALTDPWAARELTICIRSFEELPPYARQLVEHLRTAA